MEIRWSGRRIGGVTAVYALATVVLVVVAIADVVVLRSNLSGFGQDLLAPGLFRRVWWDVSRVQVALIVVSACAAIATHALLRGRNGSTTSTRLGLAGAAVWLVGTVAASRLPGLTGSDAGWFNYAPNAGVVFSSGNGLDRELIGLVIACVGLAITAGAIAWPALRRGRRGLDT